MVDLMNHPLDNASLAAASVDSGTDSVALFLLFLLFSSSSFLPGLASATAEEEDIDKLTHPSKRRSISALWCLKR